MKAKSLCLIVPLFSILQDKLPASTYKVLADYHSTTVKLLALQAAATDDVSPLTQLQTYIYLFMLLHWRKSIDIFFCNRYLILA